MRIATAAEIPRMVALINAAFAVETFIEGPRTGEHQMSEMMLKGEFLVAADDTGRVIASVFAEARGDRGYFGMLAVDPSEQRPPRTTAAIVAAGT